MKCHKCNQDSIGVKNGKIFCSVCGLELHFTNLENELCLFLYNIELEEARELGKQAYRDDKHKPDNPYALSSSQISHNHSWKEGFENEEKLYERDGFFLSAENLNKELKKLIRDKELLTRQSNQLTNNVSDLKKILNTLNDQTFWWGSSYRQYISKIVEGLEGNPDS